MAEPEWDEDTRNLALAFDQVALCPKCGGPRELCHDPEHQFDWETPPPIRCHRFTALLEAQRGVDENTNPLSAALIWRLPVLRDEG